jgi:hypothetical protein
MSERARAEVKKALFRVSTLCGYIHQAQRPSLWELLTEGGSAGEM